MNLIRLTRWYNEWAASVELNMTKRQEIVSFIVFLQQKIADMDGDSNNQMNQDR